MSNDKWGSHIFSDGYNPMSVGIFTPNISTLATKILAGTFGNNLTAIEDYINNIVYFPLSRSLFNFSDYCLAIVDELFINISYTKRFDDISASLLSNGHPFFRGFYMGKYDFNQHISNDFTDFEPYTNILVYLPYYGYAELSVKDVYKKIALFRLVIDFRTGQGTYYIYSTENDYEYELGDHTFYVNNLYDAICIGTYTFQLGVNVPISTTGSADRNRDVILSLSSTAISAAITGTLTGLPVSYISSSSYHTPQTNKAYQKNYTTNRLNVAEKIEFGEHSTYIQTYKTIDPVHQYANTIGQLANNVLATFASSPTATKGGSPTNYMYDTQKIHIIIKKANVIPANNKYNHIFGRPLGEVKNVKDLSGYTRFIDFHLEASGEDISANPNTSLGFLNTEEMEMINEIMTSGVYI